MKKWLIGKDPDAGQDWRQEEKGTTENEVVGWPHRLDGSEFEQVPGVGDGQGGLVCCSPWGHKESDTTERLNWKLNFWLSNCVFSFSLQETDCKWLHGRYLWQTANGYMADTFGGKALKVADKWDWCWQSGGGGVGWRGEGRGWNGFRQ